MICPSCAHSMPHKENVFGTMCSKCGKYIPPVVKPKMVQEAEKVLAMNQQKIRIVLKQMILGDKDGDQVQQKS